MTTHTIELRIDTREGVWTATHSDPEVRALFGTATLPTAFMATADPTVVLDTITRLNPDRTVTMSEPDATYGRLLRAI